MDNFSVFNQEKLAASIEAFLPGATPHITPITYRAWTPDIFLFLFRATNQDDEDHFFALVSYDYLQNEQDSAALILKRWLDLTVVTFLPSGETDSEGGNLTTQADDIYKSCLARVERPQHLGYWTNNIVITKSSDVGKELAGFTTEQRSEVEGLLAKNQDYSIAVYKNDDGSMELFYS